MRHWWLARWALLPVFVSGPIAAEARTQGEPARIVRELLFVIVTDPRPSAAFGRADYEAVVSRARAALSRETDGRIELRADFVEVPFGDSGYGARTFLEWYEDLRDATAGRRFDALAFAPDRPRPWCTDAHSLGVVVDDAIFTCLEAPAPLPLASNLLVHKLFHGFGFFHQHLRNKQLRLLDWELGLPSYTAAADVVTDESLRREIDAMMFLSKAARDALDRGLLRCDQPGDAPEQCRDVVGPFSWDIDGDGVIDAIDGYPVSPPRGGPDSDHDGIPDALDLCPDTELVVRGVSGGPMNFWSDAPEVTLSVTRNGAPLEARWAAASVDVGKSLGDLMYFDASRETASSRIPLERGVPVRVRAFYDDHGRRARRSFWIYGESSRTSPGPWAYFDEKEWLYFGRFGCDPPAGFDAWESKPSDAIAPPPSYDWDGDGVPDREDSLPTVSGTCSDAHVRGVRDSDGDGFCDPGTLVLDRLPPDVKRTSYFGEIPTGMGDDPDFDRCPYVAGPDRGCPR